MMQLRYSTTSPFARKVIVVANELGIADKLELLTTKVRVHDELFFAQNPLAKIPVLITENGDSIFDSKVICEYLDSKFAGGRLLPATGVARWRALTWINLADGMVDAGLLARQEETRPSQQRSLEALQFQLDKVTRSLDWFDRNTLTETDKFGIKEITLACAVEWLIFRFGENTTLNGRGQLASWYKHIKSRPSFTHPALA